MDPMPMNLTTEQVRFHAAGHVAAAVLLVEAGMVSAAKTVLADVARYVNHARVVAPEAVKALMAGVMAAPGEMLTGLRQLEAWLVDPFNTTIEKSGGAGG